LIRVLKGSQSAISRVFYVDGEPANATGTPTVTVVRDSDGTTIVNAQNASAITGVVGGYAYELTPTNLDRLDELTATWNVTLDGAAQTFTQKIEVVGGFICSLGQIDGSLNRGGNEADYANSNKAAARMVAEDAFEREAGVAFVPRYRKVSLDGWSGTDLLLPNSQITTIRSVSVDGTAYTQDQLDALGLYGETGVIYNESSWTRGRRNVEVVYEHGYRWPPADVERAVALIATSILKDGPWDDRGFAVTDDAGTVRLLTAGVSGAAFSIPDVQAALNRYRVPVIA
jgi:hypothetical protein